MRKLLKLRSCVTLVITRGINIWAGISRAHQTGAGHTGVSNRRWSPVITKALRFGWPSKLKEDLPQDPEEKLAVNQKLFACHLLLTGSKMCAMVREFTI